MLIFNNYLGMPTQQEREKDFPPTTHLQRQLLEGHPCRDYFATQQPK